MNSLWKSIKATLCEEADIVLKSNNKIVITPGLKVLNKKSNIRYTVSAVNDFDVVLRTPEGEKFTVLNKEFENLYKID